MLNRVHVKGESATPHQTTETFPVGPLTLSPEPEDIIGAKKKKKCVVTCSDFPFPGSSPSDQNTTAVWATACCAKKLDGWMLLNSTETT